MPNWCSNTLTVESDNIEQLNDFKEKAIHYKEDDTEKQWPSLTFNKLVPCPEELLNEAAFGAGANREDLVTKYGASDWYQWRVENWGTKWDAADADTLDNELIACIPAFTSYDPNMKIVSIASQEKNGNFTKKNHDAINYRSSLE
jgi:hypothetical protein